MRTRTYVLKAGFLVPLAIIAGLLLNVGPADAQVASPLQGGHYATRTTNIRDMAAPPPGLFIMLYNWIPRSTSFYDRDGNEVKSLNPSQIDPTLPDADISFKVNGLAMVPVVAWASPFTLLGGGRYMVAVSPNYLVADYEFVARPGDVGGDTSAVQVIEGTVSGFSDLFVSPVGLSWGLNHFDFTVNYGFAAPTGKYTTGAEDNLGLGFWTHQFQGYGYVYPFTHQATAIMAALTYEVNTKIEDVDVKPGNRLSLEWGVSQYVTEWMELGVQGGHTWQVSDDKGDDVVWDPSVRDRKSGIAFGVGFWPWAQRLYVSGKYGFDFGIRQGFKNNALTVNFLFLTNALTGS